MNPGLDVSPALEGSAYVLGIVVCAFAATPTRLATANDRANAPLALRKNCMMAFIVLEIVLSIELPIYSKGCRSSARTTFSASGATHDPTFDCSTGPELEEFIGNRKRNTS